MVGVQFKEVGSTDSDVAVSTFGTLSSELRGYQDDNYKFLNMMQVFQSAFDSASNTWSPVSTTATWSTTSDKATSIFANGGWVAAVPEPSTAALALAGLALLLKRRKA